MRRALTRRPFHGFFAGAGGQETGLEGRGVDAVGGGGGEVPVERGRVLIRVSDDGNKGFPYGRHAV